MGQVIYKITFPNGLVYIGRTNNVNRRWASHKRKALSPGRKSIVHCAMASYGIENLRFEVIEETTDSDVFDREVFWIKKYRSTEKGFGYNISKGGKDLWYGLKEDIPKERWNEISARRHETQVLNGTLPTGDNNPMSLVSIAKRFRCSIDEARALTPNYGKERPLTVKEMASKTHKGKEVSTDTRRKIASSLCKYEYIIRNLETGETIVSKNLAEVSVNLGFDKTALYCRIGKTGPKHNTGPKGNEQRRAALGQWVVEKKSE